MSGEFKFHVKAKFGMSHCENLDSIFLMDGIDADEAEDRLIEHLIEHYENDNLDEDSIEINLIKEA